jgi:L-glyceraldehyde 3-phosphate reductase
VRTSRFLNESDLTDDRLRIIRGLNEVARGRGQSLAQLALVWALRDPRMTSLIIGASSVAQLEDNVGALSTMEIAEAELAAIESLLSS